MSIINTITNLVDLNTTKYSKKLKAMKADTKNATKSMGSSFAGIGSAWKAAIAAVATGALAGAITKELKATETAVASFISTAGGVTEARAQFEMLQQAARDTIQPFDALKAVALDLRKNGIQATADQLKTFSQIAYGTGQSLETVGRAFTATIQGRYKALNQLGIVAQDNGAKIALTYKGITTEIDKNSEALSDYFKKIGQQNEGVLDYLQGGITGALNQLENAWGDFYRALAESGLGKLISDAVRTSADALDGLTSWINTNRPYFESFFNQVREGFGAIADAVKQTVAAGLKYVEQFFDDGTDEAKTGLSNIGFFLSQFFNFARKGFLEYIAKPAAITWESIRGGFESASEYLAALAYTGDFDEAANAYDRTLNRTADNIAETSRLYDKAIQFQIEEIDKNRAELERKLREPIDTNTPAVTLEPVKFKTGRDSGGKAGKAGEDSWTSYISKIQQMQRDAYGNLEKLRADYNDSIAELMEAYKNSTVATEEDLANARAVIDADYLAKYKQLTAEAQEFLRGIRGDELEQLEAEYAEKLEKLQKFHEDQLISETEFLEARDNLRKDFEKSQATAKANKNQFFTAEDLENLQTFSDGLSTLGDAFGNLTASMSQSSGAYKAMFAIEKSFAIASATANAIVTWSKALGTAPNWYVALANYAQAVALTTGIISQISSLTMHDKGGSIPAGGLGIVGEYGPELIQGPATITSRKQTADLARQAVNGGGSVTVNLYENAEKAGQVDQSEGTAGERIINIFVSNIRKGGQIARTLESTYQVKRFGA